MQVPYGTVPMYCTAGETVTVLQYRYSLAGFLLSCNRAAVLKMTVGVLYFRHHSPSVPVHAQYGIYNDARCSTLRTVPVKNQFDPL